MRSVSLWLLIPVSLGILGTGCHKAELNAPNAPTLSAADQAKKAEISRKAQITFRMDQINRSNLPPDQKQRLIQQLNASAGK